MSHLHKLRERRPSGSIAAGLGSTGLLQGLDQINTYADQIASVQFNLLRLHTGNTLTWVLQHPAVLVPVAIVECASKWPNPLWLAGAGLVVAALAAKAGLRELGDLFWTR
jgi:hypothetical protein